MSCLTKDDQNVFVILRKKDKHGNPLLHLNFPLSATPVASIDSIPSKDRTSLNLHLGSTGVLRASHRDVDESRGVHPNFPFHPHTRERRVPCGEIVKLETGIWNASVDFEAGESVTLQVGGKFPGIAEYTAWSAPRPEWELNRGYHRIHCGPGYPSRLILPLVPREDEVGEVGRGGTHVMNGVH